jgi:hypothetical protein
MQALRGNRLGAADVVLVERVAAIDDRIAGLHMFGECSDRLLSDLAGRQHHPHRTRLFQTPQQIGKIGRPDGAFAGNTLHRIRAVIIHHAMMPRPHQAQADIATHPAKADYAQLHDKTPKQTKGLCFFLSRKTRCGAARHKNLLFLKKKKQKDVYPSACATASVNAARPAVTSPPRCTRRARRPRSANTPKSPRACAAFTTEKL